MQLPLAVLRVDRAIQPRVELNWFVIAEYAEAMRDGAVFPPVTVFFDETDYWLADGFHRFHAAQEASLAEITVECRVGSRRDALLYSVGTNATHGLRRTNADKRRAVLTLLTDTEWQQWSDREIARQCAVSNRFVTTLRHEVTVNRSQSTSRMYVTKHGTVAKMNTAQIGISQRIEPAVRDAIRDTPLVDKQPELVALARLDPRRQAQVAEKIVTGAAHRVKDALWLLYREAKTALPAGVLSRSSRYLLLRGDSALEAAPLASESIDVIITDPPYAHEYLPLYEALACTAARVLKRGGSLVVLTGQAILPKALAAMMPYLHYQWMLAYLLIDYHGMQYQARAFNGWKPVLWFTRGDYTGNFIYDVVTSRVEADWKAYHPWQQTVTGFTDLVTRFSNPGDIILDPFCVTGTTGIAALQLGRRFIGIDNDTQALAIATQRLFHKAAATEHLQIP